MSNPPTKQSMEDARALFVQLWDDPPVAGSGDDDTMQRIARALDAFAAKAVAKERERCAQVLDDFVALAKRIDPVPNQAQHVQRVFAENMARMIRGKP